MGQIYIFFSTVVMRKIEREDWKTFLKLAKF